MTIQETIDPKAEGLGEGSMVGKERWDEIQRLRAAGETVSAIARRLELDRKTVRSWLQKGTWTAYRREEPGDRLLDEHGVYLRERACAVLLKPKTAIEDRSEADSTE
jgi:transposase